jgi:hypothetical protein
MLQTMSNFLSSLVLKGSMFGFSSKHLPESCNEGTAFIKKSWVKQTKRRLKESF